MVLSQDFKWFLRVGSKYLKVPSVYCRRNIFLLSIGNVSGNHADASSSGYQHMRLQIQYLYNEKMQFKMEDFNMKMQQVSSICSRFREYAAGFKMMQQVSR